jgi:hypothetical protein
MTTIQFNFGEQMRVGGRDYNERRIPDSMKVYLATTPSNQLDEEAIDNERLFFYRFAMDRPRAAREQVIAIKQKFGLTDAECRWLRRSGQLRVTRSEAKVVPDRWVPAQGWLYALMLLALCGTELLVIAFSNAPAWRQTLSAAVVAGPWLGAIWLINRLYLEPWRWLKLVGARQ